MYYCNTLSVGIRFYKKFNIYLVKLSSLVKLMSCLVQFCEFISVSWLLNLVGRVVSILLDYVGQVSLCSKLMTMLETRREWPHIHRTIGELKKRC